MVSEEFMSIHAVEPLLFPTLPFHKRVNIKPEQNYCMNTDLLHFSIYYYFENCMKSLFKNKSLTFL